MKLATLKRPASDAKGRDGRLVVVGRDLKQCVPVPRVAKTLQQALDNWDDVVGELRSVYRLLNQGEAKGARRFSPKKAMSPLPRAYQWADGSAYVVHVELVRNARGADLPQSFWTDPLMYQGGSDGFLGPCDPIPCQSEDWGIDFEAEIAAITDDVPMGITPDQARHHVKLLMLVNDVSLRNLIPGELAKGFGFFHAKPASSFSPVAVEPAELGAAWDGGKVTLPLVSTLNGKEFGRPNAGTDMTFDFGQLIAHAARTRALAAGTIIGSGTVANRDRSVGSSCIAERRMVETIDHGKPATPFMRFGDRIRIEMLDGKGQSIFGAIDQQVVAYTPPN
ncbi:MAG: fumarylacetoacetate hydrolase family protein [Alphaproteobacteria bacterium]|nr:fumarylacetoacetate hydrolase family protein [Alphaproteobacteria bacterium]